MSTTDGPRHPLTASQTGDFLAAIPAILRYHPRNIVALAAFDPDGTLGPVLHCDLEREPAETPLDALVEMFTNTARSRHCREVIITVIDDDACGESDAHRALAEHLARGLASAGHHILDGYLCREIAAHAPWWRVIGDPASGTIPDPRASPLAMAVVVSGHTILPSRAAIDAILAPDTALAAEVAALLATGTPCGHPRHAPTVDTRAGVELFLHHIHRLASGTRPSAAGIAALAAALTTPVRDVLFALAVTDDARDAEGLWILLARALPDPLRAEPAVLLAHSALLGRNGPLVDVGLALAEDVAPDHVMAARLREAMWRGTPLHTLADIAIRQHRHCTSHGVGLPPVTHDRARWT